MHTYALESACELLQASFLNLTMENNEKTVIDILRRIILEKGISSKILCRQDKARICITFSIPTNLVFLVIIW